jgi:hypothetical protein
MSERDRLRSALSSGTLATADRLNTCGDTLAEIESDPNDPRLAEE